MVAGLVVFGTIIIAMAVVVTLTSSEVVLGSIKVEFCSGLGKVVANLSLPNNKFYCIIVLQNTTSDSSS